MKRIDMIGKRFGQLTVIGVEPSINKRTMLKCLCDCGNEVIVDRGNLTRGNTKSCGCLKFCKKDLTGMVFGELTVTGFAGYHNHKAAKWECKCSCGKELVAFGNSLLKGETKSCGGGVHSPYVGQKFGKLTVTSEIRRRGEDGILSREHLCVCDCGGKRWARISALKIGNVTSCGCGHVRKRHGMSNTRIYKTWLSMIGRCEIQSNTDYWKYGAVGISVCDEWHDFMTFYKWAMDNGYTDGLTIDRKDNSGNYEPSNCRWATYKQQANNLRSNVIVEYNGQEKTLSEWADYFNIPYRILHNRYRNLKWDFDRATTQPIRPPRKRKKGQ